MRAVELRALADRKYIAEDRDLTVTFRPENLVDIAIELNEIAKSFQPLLPSDICSATKILDVILQYVFILCMCALELLFTYTTTG